MGRDPDTEFRRADKNQDGLVTDKELKEWSAAYLMKSRQEDAPTDPTLPLSRKQRYAVFVNQMVPFIGFGFMDNAIMILAGDKIDMTLGMTLGMSTMAAAGLGNLLSDVCGIGFGGFLSLFLSALCLFFSLSLSETALSQMALSLFLCFSLCTLFFKLSSQELSRRPAKKLVFPLQTSQWANINSLK